ncbi:uncharacterized protein LOC114541145 [Dendronephthya gigantea]|uniref:uncharacterized protein LOC114541145 n=1 Tax=Dendronephthya gigantea TaxID=151771 RepID=UPI00106BDB6A|nr:uncharacterized protein LOC114541145 [Dendronephthya gigantea]
MFAEAINSTNPQPYIAAVFSSSENMFVLGDGRNASDSKEYFNGPLGSGTRYSIFERIIINDKGDYYSNDWSPDSQTTNPPETNNANNFDRVDDDLATYTRNVSTMKELLKLSMGSFTPVVFSAYGGCGRETYHFLSFLAGKLAEKKNFSTYIVLNW